MKWQGRNIIFRFAFLLFVLFIASGCSNESKNMKSSKSQKIIFLHHSTGNIVWRGTPNKYIYKINKRGDTEKWLKRMSREEGVKIDIEERNFPSKEPYGWKNYPYDYYNIWVKNSGEQTYANQPTLEILTREYDIIIFKHCFPVSNIEEDTVADINSEVKTLENYKLQYEDLKKKMHEFPDTKFLVWTPAVKTTKNLSPQEADRTYIFYNWIKNTWDEPGDNIFLWDFYSLETEGGKYLKPEFARSETDSHPSREFGGRVSEYFARRIIQVVLNIADMKDIRVLISSSLRYQLFNSTFFFSPGYKFCVTFCEV